MYGINEIINKVLYFYMNDISIIIYLVFLIYLLNFFMTRRYFIFYPHKNTVYII